MLVIENYEIYKVTLPLGRVIGDNNCSYEDIELLAIALKTNHGHIGWGYSESVWKGTFKNEAWYIRRLPSVSQLEIDFIKTWWEKIKGRNPFDLESERKNYQTGSNMIDAAIRLAIWDLMAQEKNMPLYRLLNGSTSKTQALSYGSILDFPLSDKQTLDLLGEFMSAGFKIIKVKVGAENVERDVNRLKLIQSFVGKDVQLTADGNEAWDWQTALQRLEVYEKNGIHLHYLEDPLNHKDFEGLKELCKRSPVPIIGHDYINQFDTIRQMIEECGLKGIRTGKDIDYSLKCIELAEEYDIPVYLGNSMFEVNAHLALAFDKVDRTEYSHLKTNDLLISPIKFKDGFIQAPTQSGHGLHPDLEKITLFSTEATI